ncbi:uncharacterized protein BDV14DRAFT_185020 [Aspergillus stella-maris]|uniref:uncharacterized protein n=1 Tax=Aspergillus stella-maris TaxID=1810926 RepID=UPI003CCE1598
MDPETKSPDPLPSSKVTVREEVRDVVENNVPPTNLLLEDTIIQEASTSTPLYKLSRCVTRRLHTTPKNSSVTFERAELSTPENAGLSQTETYYKHIFYLAHPAGAQYRSDIPAYYITSVEANTTLGNLHFETSKPRFQKPEFAARLSANRTSADKPLFDDADQANVLFTARPAKWLSGISGYTWFNDAGQQVAVENGPGRNGQYRLDISVPQNQEMRDALVSLWALRLWYETAESKEAKREELERLTPAVPYHQDLKQTKRVGALGSFAAGGC